MTIRPSVAVAAGTDMAAAMRRGLLAGAGILAIVVPCVVGSARLDFLSAPGTGVVAGVDTGGARFADFGTEKVSPDVRHVADWVADSRNAGQSDFVIIDKKHARVYVFDAGARLRGAAPVLLGAAKGDESVPGIGSKPVAEVLPAERTTPAGRFVAERGHNTRGEDVVWVDYDGALSMHRVLTTNSTERRLERLASPTTEDNRISYGCINVPAAFYDVYIRPVFAIRRAVVYVLPEVKTLQQVFGSYDVATAHVLASGPSSMSSVGGR